MRHLPLPLLAAAVLLSGCKDRPQQTPTETAPEAALEARAPAGTLGESTVCAAYHKQLQASRAELARAADDESLRETVATYEAVIADACP